MVTGGAVNPTSTHPGRRALHRRRHHPEARGDARRRRATCCRRARHARAGGRGLSGVARWRSTTSSWWPPRPPRSSRAVARARGRGRSRASGGIRGAERGRAGGRAPPRRAAHPGLFEALVRHASSSARTPARTWWHGSASSPVRCSRGLSPRGRRPAQLARVAARRHLPARPLRRQEESGSANRRSPRSVPGSSRRGGERAQRLSRDPVRPAAGRGVALPRPGARRGVERRRDATRFGPGSLQADRPLATMLGIVVTEQSEDCLTLNVWTPARPGEGGARRPVMVWIHGGAW